jgi:hypothetical protein
MTYDEVAKSTDQLSYREKLKLAQRLLQTAMKQEEEQNPDRREMTTSAGPLDPDLVQYVAERLRKLKPARKDAVLNSIGAMFQFRGGISEKYKEEMFAAPMKARQIVVTETGKVSYS